MAVSQYKAGFTFYFLVFGFKITMEELFLDECLLKYSGDHFGVNLSE